MLDLSKILGRHKKAADEMDAALGDLRAQIEAKRAALAEVEAAPVPVDEAEKRLDRWLDRIGLGADLDLRGLTAEKLAEPALSIVRRPDGSTDAGPAALEVFGLLVASCRDQVRDHLAELLADAYEAKPAPIAAVDRVKRRADLEAEIDALEIAEERAVRALEEAGLAVLRRSDARPQIVLASDKDLAG